MSDFTCKLCGGKTDARWRVRDAKAASELSMSLCLSCGLVQQSDLPSDDELKIYYSHHYRADYKNTYTPKPKYVQRAGKAALDRLAFIARHVNLAPGARSIDIGAGGGEFVYLAHRAGFAATGIEPNLGYSEFARQAYDIEVRTATLDEQADGSADLVTMFHVLEHMAHPQSVFKKLFHMLREGGYAVIEVPNILQNDASPHNIFFKAHLFYYSGDTLAAAASRYFEIVRIEDRGNLRALLRRRSAPIDFVLPRPERVAFARARLKQKGWLEYVTLGGGWAKPFRRLGLMAREAAIGDVPPRAILDSLWQDRPVRLGASSAGASAA